MIADNVIDYGVATRMTMVIMEASLVTFSMMWEGKSEDKVRQRG